VRILFGYERLFVIAEDLPATTLLALDTGG